MEFSKEQWPEALFQALIDNDVYHFPFIPDAGNSRLIEYAEQNAQTTATLLTTEEEGVAFCAGMDLVGKRAALLMQSSGVGNCINFLALSKGARFPLLMIVSMRGGYGEPNPWQYPMGQATTAVLETMGIICYEITSLDDLKKATTAALSTVFNAGQSVALILTQQFLRAKSS